MTDIIEIESPDLILQSVEWGTQVIAHAPIQINEGGNIPDGNKGDITVSGSGTNWEINDSAKGRKKLDFSFGDVTTQTIYQAIAGQRITRVELTFDVAFNVASMLSIGDGTDTQRLMDTGQNYPLIQGVYSSHPSYRYLSNTNILLTLNAGIGATQGSGSVIVYYE